MPLPRSSVRVAPTASPSSPLARSGATVAFLGLSFLLAAPLGCVSGADGQATVDEAKAMAPSSRTIPKSPRFAPPPLRAGQWARYLVTSEGSGPAASAFVYTIKVIEAGDLAYSFWFEEEYRAAGRLDVARTQMVMDDSRVAVAGGDDSFEPTVTDYGRNVRTLISRGGGSAAEVPRTELPPGLVLLETRAAFFGGVELGKARKSKVRGAEFKGCYEAKGRITMSGKEGPLSGCLDAQVPIHGVVEASDPLGRRWELLDFGFAGATSALP